MTKPPRILHVISRLDGYGGARLLRFVAARQAAAGQEVGVAALQADEAVAAELTAAGVAVHPLGSRWRCDPIAMGRFARLRRRRPHDVIHAWDPTALEYAALPGGRSPVVAAWTSSRPAPHWLSRAVGPTFATLSPGAELPHRARRERSDVLFELGLSADARIVAVAGPLVRAKEFDEAIWCFELVRVLHPQARMLVFGDGPDRERLARFAELVSEPGWVAFCGFRPDWTQVLPAVDVYWQLDPARTTPFALLEAMACGVPTVVGNVPALRAAVASGETGLVAVCKNRADVARTTDELLRDAALARRLGKAATIAVRDTWSIDASVAACEALYSRLGPRSLTGG